jgi:hypothetical protein
MKLFRDVQMLHDIKIIISMKKGCANWNLKASNAANGSRFEDTCRPIELQQATAKGHERNRCSTDAPLTSFWE